MNDFEAYIVGWYYTLNISEAISLVHISDKILFFGHKLIP